MMTPSPVLALDPRVIPSLAVAFIRSCQARVACHLGGGAALAGAHLHHRPAPDAHLFVHDREQHRVLIEALPDIVRALALDLRMEDDRGTVVRARVDTAALALELEVVYQPLPDLEPALTGGDGIAVESLADLRASKLASLLAGSEPRDLVDLFFLDRVGFPPERDLVPAHLKDAGIDAGILAWVLRDFPCAPLPALFVPASEAEVVRFRNDLRERFRRLADAT